MSPSNMLYRLEGRQAAAGSTSSSSGGSSDSSGGSSSLSSGAVAGIAVAATAAAAAAAGGGLLMLQRRRRRLRASSSEAGKASKYSTGGGPMVDVGWAVPPSGGTGPSVASWHSAGAAASRSHVGYAGVMGGGGGGSPDRAPPWARGSTAGSSGPPSSSPNASGILAGSTAPSWVAVQTATLYTPSHVPASPFAAMAMARAKSSAAVQQASTGSVAPDTATYAPHGSADLALGSARSAGGRSGRIWGTTDGSGSRELPSGSGQSSGESRMLPELAQHVADVDAAMSWGDDEGEVRLRGAALCARRRCRPVMRPPPSSPLPSTAGRRPAAHGALAAVAAPAEPQPAGLACAR